MQKIKAASWAIGFSFVALTLGLGVAVMQPVNVMQESASQLRKVKAKSEGLKESPDRFEVSPLAQSTGMSTSMRDVMNEEKVTPERTRLLSLSDKADLLMDQGRYSEAIPHYNVVIDYLDDCERRGKLTLCGSMDSVNLIRATAYSARAFCLLQRKKDYEAGIADLTKAIALRPFYAVNFENRARAYFLLGKKDLAAKDLRKAAELNSMNRADQN